MLTSTVGVAIYGKLDDDFGRKIILILGIVLFLLGSALSGAAQTMTQWKGHRKPFPPAERSPLLRCSSCPMIDT
jgi:MFS family permease